MSRSPLCPRNIYIGRKKTFPPLCTQFSVIPQIAATRLYPIPCPRTHVGTTTRGGMVEVVNLRLVLHTVPSQISSRLLGATQPSAASATCRGRIIAFPASAPRASGSPPLSAVELLDLPTALSAHQTKPAPPFPLSPIPSHSCFPPVPA